MDTAVFAAGSCEVPAEVTKLAFKPGTHKSRSLE